MLIKIPHTHVFGPFYCSFVRHQLVGNNIHKSRFALAISANQTNMLSFQKPKRNICKNRSISKSVRKIFYIQNTLSKSYFQFSIFVINYISDITGEQQSSQYKRSMSNGKSKRNQNKCNAYLRD